MGCSWRYHGQGPKLRGPIMYPLQLYIANEVSPHRTRGGSGCNELITLGRARLGHANGTRWYAAVFFLCIS
jgi:hypothetical protein